MRISKQYAMATVIGLLALSGALLAASPGKCLYCVAGSTCITSDTCYGDNCFCMKTGTTTGICVDMSLMPPAEGEAR